MKLKKFLKDSGKVTEAEINGCAGRPSLVILAQAHSIDLPGETAALANKPDHFSRQASVTDSAALSGQDRGFDADNGEEL